MISIQYAIADRLFLLQSIELLQEFLNELNAHDI